MLCKGVLPARLVSILSIYVGLPGGARSVSWPEDVRASAARAAGTTSNGGGGAPAGSSGETHRHVAPGRAAADRRRVLRRRGPRHGRAIASWWAPAMRSPHGQGACVYEQRRSGQRVVGYNHYSVGNEGTGRRFAGVVNGRRANCATTLSERLEQPPGRRSLRITVCPSDAGYGCRGK
jgi:hypothetical protein